MTAAISIDPLLAALEEFQSLRRGGDRTPIDDFVKRFPHLSELRELLLTAGALESAKPEESAPARLGEYRLLREIGRGGMGVVYEAVQESLDRRVAVKILARRDGTLAERFQREARLAARLHHTNIVPVFAVGDDAGLPFYVMQFIDGSCLNQWTASAKTIDHSTVASLGLQAAEALAYAHQQSVLHRDLKPANLLLDSAGTLWIADFGLAKAAGDGDLTGSGAILGTLRYMAPERLAGTCDDRRVH